MTLKPVVVTRETPTLVLRRRWSSPTFYEQGELRSDSYRDRDLNLEAVLFSANRIYFQTETLTDIRLYLLLWNSNIGQRDGRRVRGGPSRGKGSRGSVVEIITICVSRENSPGILSVYLGWDFRSFAIFIDKGREE